MKKQITGVFCAGLMSLGMLSTADAALVSQLGGLAVYDTDLDITWLANAHAGAGSAFDDGISTTNGEMTWASANAWAASLTVGGFTDWRLPTSDATCLGFNCTGSEMGHLFYNELGGTAGQSILASGDLDLALFTNIQTGGAGYWSATEVVLVLPGERIAWGFSFDVGHQGLNDTRLNDMFAWAVRSGAVPIPAAVWLFGSGLIGLLGFRLQV